MASFSYGKFKASTVTHPIGFLYMIRSTDGFIYGDFHNQCQDEQDDVIVYWSLASKF